MPLIPYLRASGDHVALELALDELAGALGKLLLTGRRIAPALGELARRLGGGIRLALAALLLAGELRGDLVRGGVDERARAVDHPRGLQLRQLRALLRERRERLRRDVAREAALELDQAPEVAREHGALEVALDEHDHGLVAEVVLEALRVLERARPLGHDRVGAGARLESQRERGAAEGEHADDGERQHRTARNGPYHALEHLSPQHRVRLGTGGGQGLQLRELPGLAHEAAEVGLLAAGRRDGPRGGEDELRDQVAQRARQERADRPQRARAARRCRRGTCRTPAGPAGAGCSRPARRRGSTGSSAAASGRRRGPPG